MDRKRIVKCQKHDAEAVAVCVYCGRALCPGCGPSPAGNRMVCSPDCAAALLRADQTLSQLAAINRQLLQKSIQSAKASAFYCYLCAGLSAAAAVGAWFMLPSPFLIYFTAACAVVLFIAGFWYGRAAKQYSPDA